MTMSIHLILLLVVLCSVTVHSKSVETTSSPTRSKRTTAHCDPVTPLFHSWNITVAPGKSKGSVCGGECCDDATENILRKRGQKDFASLLRHNSRSVQGLLNLTGTTLQRHVEELSHQSENKTLLLFSQVYKGMSVLSRQPIAALYADIRAYILVNSSQPDFATSAIDIKGSVTQFFSDFFPLVYHHILLHNSANVDFADDYKTCLRRTLDTILPFGEIPQQISQSLSMSLEATRLLLQAFRVGTEVLNTTDSLLVDEGAGNAQCHDALLKMTHCPRCQGLVKHAKPCAGYCLNVLRGCLTKYVAELDAPWNGYVEGIESLVNGLKRNNPEWGANADFVFRTLDTKISEAIMRAMEKGQDIDSKVKRHCGPPTFSTKTAPLALEAMVTLPSISKPRSATQRVFASLPETQLIHFQNSIAKTRGFYGNLADTLCQDDNFAEPKDQRCWNGKRIAEYTQTVVDVGLDMQKYNPEVKPMPNSQSVDPRVAVLVDKLRHVHHMAMSSMGSSFAEVDYMQRDGADGSGSGAGPNLEDEDEEIKGSGSGNGPHADDDDNDHHEYHSNGHQKPNGSGHGKSVTTPAPGSCSSLKASVGVALVALTLLRLY